MAGNQTNIIFSRVIEYTPSIMCAVRGSATVTVDGGGPLCGISSRARYVQQQNLPRLYMYIKNSPQRRRPRRRSPWITFHDVVEAVLFFYVYYNGSIIIICFIDVARKRADGRTDGRRCVVVRAHVSGLTHSTRVCTCASAFRKLVRPQTTEN